MMYLSILGQFLILAMLVTFFGYRLTKDVDRLSDATGISASVLGVFLLGIITSLPELITSITAGYLGRSDMVVGNIFGSNLFNILIVFLLFFFVPKDRPRKVLRRFDNELFFTFFYGIAMSFVLFLGIMLANKGFTFPRLLGITALPWALFLMYIGYIVWQRSQGGAVEHPSPQEPEAGDLRRGINRLVLKIIIWSTGITISAILLTYVCDKIAGIEIAGVPIGQTFAGTLFLAMATSMPEVSVSLSAAKIGAIKMSIGNVVGSNIFNCTIPFFANAVLLGKTDVISTAGMPLIPMLFLLVFTLFLLISYYLSLRLKREYIGIAFLGIGIYILSLAILYIKR